MSELHGDAPSASSISVIGPQFCVPYAVEIVVNRKGQSLRGDKFVITDVNEKIMFKVKQNNSGMHKQRLLVDAADNPIATLREKVWTEHYRWQVFHGESKDQKDLIFCSKTPQMIQSRTHLNVYLANNTKEKSCDFKIEGSWSNRASTFYKGGESSTIIAQMHMKKPAGSSMALGKDKFMVTISPNVDHAFIVALIALLEETKTDMATTSKAMAIAAVGLS